MKNILIVASSGEDPEIDAVTAALDARGANPLRFDTDQFPTDAQLTIAWDDAERMTLRTAGHDIDLSSLSAIWMRHLAVGAELPSEMDETEREAARVQSDITVWSALDCLDCFVLDPISALLSSPHKPKQMQLARAFGLTIPRTLVTNDPSEVRSFFARCGGQGGRGSQGRLIAKLVDSAAVSTVDADGRTESIPTTEITAEHLDELDSLRYSPMIFQERVEKQLELRVTVVGRKVFAAAVDSRHSEKGQDDWRMDPSLIAAFEPCSLPSTVEKALLNYLDALGLNFAAVDFILTPDGRYVFLEANSPAGFAFVERSSGLPIAAAIADLLIGREAQRIGRIGRFARGI